MRKWRRVRALEVRVQCRRQPTPGCWARVPPRPLLAWGLSRAVSRAPRGVQLRLHTRRVRLRLRAARREPEKNGGVVGGSWGWAVAARRAREVYN
jgi:hypothetical protein